MSLFLGFSFGVLFALIVAEFLQVRNSQSADESIWREPNVASLNDRNHELSSVERNRQKVFNDVSSLYDGDGNKVAKLLSQEIRVLCWVLTQPKALKTKAQAVKDTWGRRCNVLLFMSSVEDKEFPAIGLNVQEGK